MSTPMYFNLNSGEVDDAGEQQIVDGVVVGGDFTGGGGSVAWTDITGKPTTFAPTIGATSTTAKAGNYAPNAAAITDATTVGRSVLTATDAAAARTAIGAGTSSLALGTTSSTALAGNDSRLSAGAAGTPTVRALGTTNTTACAGNDARLLTGSATAVNNATTFADLDAATTAYNTLLAALRTRGIITGS